MPKENRRNSINSLFSLYFLLIFAALGTLIAFMSLHFDDIGFNGVQISTITVVGSIALILLAPRFGHFFDQANDKRAVLIASILVMTFSLGSIAYLKAFVPILLLWVIYRTISGPLFSTSENLSFGIASKANSSENATFGSLRLWGSIGFASATLVGGYIYQSYGIMYNNILFLVLIALSVIVLLLMPNSIFDVDVSSEEDKLNLAGVLKLIVKNRFLFFMALALAISDPTQDGIRSFEPIFMQNLGLEAGIIGLAATLSAAGEVPFMINADRIIKRLGIREIILFVFVFDILRRLLVWVFPTPAMVFITSVLTSFSFTFRLVGSISLVNLCLPRHVTSTANAFIGVTMFSLGYMLSNALSGVIYDQFGNRHVYLLGAVLCGISLAFGLLAGKLEPLSTNQTSTSISSQS
jgi:PPP family 3-phenylpropionic acid transporter